MHKLKLFVRLTKVDEAQRIVYGTAVDETTDNSKESFDYATSKPYFEEWSGSIAKSTDGKSLGNVRAMHGKVAAGKLEQIDFDDDNKKIDVAAKIVDDNEWNKVLEGVYTGFSIGGSYVKKWKDGDVTKYTAKPVEVSLVDMPCIPTATFSMVKADGTELRKYFQPGSDKVAEKVVELAKAAGADPVADIAKFEGAAREELAKSVSNPPVVSEVAATKEKAVKEPTNDEVVAKAGEIAKAKGGSWIDHVTAARAELMKSAEQDAAPAPAAATAAPVTTPAVELDKSSDDMIADGEQVWAHPRLPGQTFKKKADMKAALVEADAVAKATATAKPASDAIAALVKAFPEKEASDEDKTAADAKAKKKKKDEKKGATAKTFTAEDLTKHLDGGAPIDSVEIIEALAGVEGIADATLKQRRVVLKAARALSALDKLPADWVIKTARLAADASDDLKKGASLCSLARMLELFATVQCYENDLEYPSAVYGGIQVPEALQTRFGQLVVEFGDIIAEILDVILAAVRDEEAAEAMTRAAAAGDMLKGVSPTADTLAKVSGKVPAGDAEKVIALEATLKAERDAFGKQIGEMADLVKGVTERLTKIESQPLPVGTSSVTKDSTLKVVEKGVDNAVVSSTAPATISDVLGNEAVLKALGDEAIRLAHSRPIRAVPGQVTR